MLSNLNNELFFSNQLVHEQYLTCKVIICGTRTRLSAEIPTSLESLNPQHSTHLSTAGPDRAAVPCQEITRVGKRD